MSIYFYNLTFNDHLKYDNASAVLTFKDSMAMTLSFPLRHLMPGLIQPNMAVVTAFGTKSLAPKFDFFSLPLLSRIVKTKILIKMTSFLFQSPYSKNVVPKNKVHF